MKTNYRLFLACAFILPLTFSCSKKASGDGSKEKGKTEEVKAMKVQEAVDWVKTDEKANSGKEVTVIGYVWNVSSTPADGVTHIDLGDVKLEGLQQSLLTVNFAADKKGSLGDVKKDKTITVKGNIFKTPYLCYMDNCELVKVE